MFLKTTASGWTTHFNTFKYTRLCYKDFASYSLIQNNELNGVYNKLSVEIQCLKTNQIM